MVVCLSCPGVSWRFSVPGTPRVPKVVARGSISAHISLKGGRSTEMSAAWPDLRPTVSRAFSRWPRSTEFPALECLFSVRSLLISAVPMSWPLSSLIGE
jgi:hypothetical protein